MQRWPWGRGWGCGCCLLTREYDLYNMQSPMSLHTHLIAILVLQVPPADGALARGVRGIWTFPGSLCDTAFDLGGRERKPVRERAVRSLILEQLSNLVGLLV